MSKTLTLRDLVNERLTLAAEEIFALFERIIAEYEDELRRSRDENERKERLLAEMQPEVLMPWARAPSPGPNLNHEIPQTLEIKAEPEEQQAEQPRPVFPPESNANFESKEESGEDDIKSQSSFQIQTEVDNKHFSDCERSVSHPDALMETEADGLMYNQIQIRGRSTDAPNPGLSFNLSAAEATFTVNHGHMLRTEDEADGKKEQCSICLKRFRCKQNLEAHFRIHTGERPYSCSICEKTFNQKSNLNKHIIIHSNQRPHRCEICEKRFARKHYLEIHMRKHTGERPFSCALCNKDFIEGHQLKVHMRTHTTELP